MRWTSAGFGRPAIALLERQYLQAGSPRQREKLVGLQQERRVRRSPIARVARRGKSRRPAGRRVRARPAADRDAAGRGSWSRQRLRTARQKSSTVRIPGLPPPGLQILTLAHVKQGPVPIHGKHPIPHGHGQTGMAAVAAGEIQQARVSRGCPIQRATQAECCTVATRIGRPSARPARRQADQFPALHPTAHRLVNLEELIGILFTAGRAQGPAEDIRPAPRRGHRASASPACVPGPAWRDYFWYRPAHRAGGHRHLRLRPVRSPRTCASSGPSTSG